MREVRGAAIVGLATIGSAKATRAALDATKSGDVYLQRLGAQIAGSLVKPVATKAAVGAYTALSAAAKVALLTAFGERREVAAAGIALQALKSEDADVRIAGARAAARVAGEKAVAPLADLAASGDDNVRNAAKECLAAVPGAAAASAILALARTGKPEVRTALMSVLGELRTPAATGVLVDTAKGEAETGIAVEALRALARFAGAAEEPAVLGVLVSTASDDVRDAARNTFLSCARRSGDVAVSLGMAIDKLAGASVPAKAALLTTLADLGGPRALDELKRAAADKDADVKRAAVTALAEGWGDAGAMPVLLDIAKSDDGASLRVVALRGYLRLTGQMDAGKPEEKVARVKDAIAVATRPDEKRQALSVLRDCRIDAAVETAAKLLDDQELFCRGCGRRTRPSRSAEER